MDKQKILIDRSSNGKRKPWREKKLANLTYAEYLEVLHFKKAKNVKTCGQVLKFARTVDGLKLYQTWFCKSRLCPLCNWRRTLKNDYDLSEILRVALQREPKARFLFLTLTQENSTSADLKNDLKELNGSVRRLFGYKAVKKNLIGFVRSTEITINQQQQTYHPHIHILLMVKPAYFKRDYLNQRQWTEFWQRARKLDYTPIVHVEAIHPKDKYHNAVQSSIAEVAKYQVKESDYLTENYDADLKIIDTLEHALAGSHQIGFGGLLKDIRHELQMDQADKNLIDVGDKKSKEILGTVMYKWSSVVKNYLECN